MISKHCRISVKKSAHGMLEKNLTDRRLGPRAHMSAPSRSGIGEYQRGTAPHWVSHRRDAHLSRQQHHIYRLPGVHGCCSAVHIRSIRIQSLQKCSLHKLKLVKHIRLVTLVAAKAGTGHLLLHARVVLFRSSFLITAHCVAADVCEAGVERCFGLFGVLRVGLGVASQSHNTRKTTVRELHTLIIPQT